MVVAIYEGCYNKWATSECLIYSNSHMRVDKCRIIYASVSMYVD